MRSKVALVVLRIWLGLWFVKAGLPKLSREYFDPADERGLKSILSRFAAEGSVEFYRPFLENVAVEHAEIFAALTMVGELAAGGGLVLGALTPFAAGGVIIMCSNYLLATYQFGPGQQTANVACLAVALTLIIGGAGRYLALDNLMFRTRKIVEPGS